MLNIVDKALDASMIKSEPNEDIDTFEYFKKLRSCLMECITAVYCCIIDLKRNSDIYGHLPRFLKFAQEICHSYYYPSTVNNMFLFFKDLIKEALGFIGDVCKHENYQAVAQYLDKNIVGQMLTISRNNSKDEETILFVNWAEAVNKTMFNSLGYI